MNISTCKQDRLAGNCELAEDFVRLARELYGSEESIPLHAPVFGGREKEYVTEAIDSTFVSSVGAYVDRFEREFAAYTGAGHAVATVNGTAALHAALVLAGVRPDDEVITQPVTFVATCNAIGYCGARPVFVDIDRQTLGMSASKLEDFLRRHGKRRGDQCVNGSTGRTLRACVPVHTLGHPADAIGIGELCERYGVTLVEDAAESLGSRRGGRHTGVFGRLSVFSFNGNKIITTGGGGMIVTGDGELAARAKHLTTTAKAPHAWAYVHDETGYNYRMPNLNAALGCAQLEGLEVMLGQKRKLAEVYGQFFERRGIFFVREPAETRSNYWLNAVVLENLAERNRFLEWTNGQGVMTRPFWELMPRLPMFRGCQADDLSNAEWLEERLVTIPSGGNLKRIESW